MSWGVKASKAWNGKDIAGDMNAELANASFNTAGRIVVDARARIHNVSGKLAKSMRRRRSRTDNAAFVFAGNRRVGVYWHYFVEYGTYDKPAHPFLRPAVDKNFNAARAEHMHAARRALNKKRREARKVA